MCEFVRVSVCMYVCLCFCLVDYVFGFKSFVAANIRFVRALASAKTIVLPCYWSRELQGEDSSPSLARLLTF